MKAVVQRVSEASVVVDGQIVGSIGVGLLVLVAAHRDDIEANAKKLANRIWGLRIFNDAEGKMNLSFASLGGMSVSDMRGLGDTSEIELQSSDADLSTNVRGMRSCPNTDLSHSGGTPETHLGREGTPGVLCVSNFTIYGETSKNRRPSFVESAPYEQGEHLFDCLVKELRKLCSNVQTGVFGADMRISLTNDGPVTVIVEG